MVKIQEHKESENAEKAEKKSKEISKMSDSINHQIKKYIYKTLHMN